jgi:hypothetical protein
VHPVLYGDNVHLTVKRTPEFQGHMTPPKARKTRSFKIRKRRLAHSFPLTALKNKHLLYALLSVKCLTNIKGKESVTLFVQKNWYALLFCFVRIKGS